MIINRLYRGMVGATAVVVLGVVSMGGAGAEATTSDGPQPVSGFEVNATAGVVDFRVSYPAAFPYAVAGGVLEATTLASGTGFASGIAGPMPVPALVNVGQLYPTNVPNTALPTPPEGRAAWESIDWHSLPNYCKSEFPDPGDRADRYCGGPAAEDARLGFTAALVNGHTKSSGDQHDPLRSASLANSRAVDVSIPALQAKIHDASSNSTSGLNRDGVPEGRSVVELDGVTVLNGLVQLAGLRSEAVAISDGTDAGTRITTSFDLREAFVAGVPVVIGRDGVSVRGQKLVPGTSMDEATKQVSEALKQAGVQVRLIPAPVSQRQGSEITAQSTGVEIVQTGTQALAASSYYRFGFAYASAGGVSSEAVSGGAAPVGGDTTPSSPPAAAPNGETAAAAVPQDAPTQATTGFPSGAAMETAGMATLPADRQTFGDGSAPIPAADPATSDGTADTSPAGEATPASESARPTVQLAVPARQLIPVSRGLPINGVKGVVTALLGLAGLGVAALPLRRVL